MLLGSCVFGAIVSFPDGVRLQLGEVVRRAFGASGLTVDEWNELTERAREHRLVDAYYDMCAKR